MSFQYYCATAAVASDFVLGLLSGLRRGRRSLSPGVGGEGRGGLPPPLELESEPGTCGWDSAGLELEDSRIFVARRMLVERPVGSGPAELEICRNAEFSIPSK